MLHSFNLITKSHFKLNYFYFLHFSLVFFLRFPFFFLILRELPILLDLHFLLFLPIPKTLLVKFLNLEEQVEQLGQLQLQLGKEDHFLDLLFVEKIRMENGLENGAHF